VSSELTFGTFFAGRYRIAVHRAGGHGRGVRGLAVLWETSNDGMTWVERAQTAIADLGFSIESLEVNFGISGDRSTSGAVRFDNFNVVP
jgi:hypothetical protein